MNRDIDVTNKAPSVWELKDDEFVHNQVNVVVKREFSAPNKEWKLSEFGEINIAKITDAFPITGNIDELDTINWSQFRNILALTLSGSGREAISDAIAALKTLSFVEEAEPVYISKYDFCSTPNDPYYYTTAGRFPNNWFLERISAPTAWDITTGGALNGSGIRVPNVTVAVADKGVYDGHSDLNVVYRELIEFTQADETTGYWYSYEHMPTSEYYHGTFVSGLIGATGNNNIGSTDVNQKVIIYPILVGDRNLYEMISDAVNANIKLMNCSFDGAYNNSSNRTAVSNYNGLIICSVGNGVKNSANISEPINIDINPIYPACFPHDNIISVGASSHYDTRFQNGSTGNAYNIGLNNVDLFAPGFDIYSTSYSLNQYQSGYHEHAYIPRGTYDVKDGTSFSAPLVAGVASLIMSLRPDLSPLDVKECIMYGVDILPAFTGYCVTGGRLNAYKALLYAMQGMTKVKNGSGCYLDATDIRP